MKTLSTKEKREYISCLHVMDNALHSYPEEIERANKVLSNCPNSLFKYKKIDKYVFDMLENKYAYLAPVKNLDDPFDCLGDFSTSHMMNNVKKVITNKFLKHIIRNTKNISLSKKQLQIIDEYKDAFKPGEDFETDKIYEALKKEGYPDEIIEEAINQYKNLVNLFDTYDKSEVFKPFADLIMHSSEKVGVCSLSEVKDNKVMWSLYGKEYKGCCIEYQIANTKKARRFLFPVIYSRNPNNNFAEKIFDSVYAELNRILSNDLFGINKEIESVGAIYELFCSKDIDWKYQKEWRIVGGAKDHFNDAEIKAVYLGFDVAPTNEKKMLTYAKRYKFDLFKMKAPDGKKRIRFKPLLLVNRD